MDVIPASDSSGLAWWRGMGRTCMNTASETVARAHVSTGRQRCCSHSLGFKSQYRGKHVFQCAYFKGARQLSLGVPTFCGTKW